MADGLDLLRTAICNHEPITLQNQTSSDVASVADATHALFANGVRISLKEPTRYRKAANSMDFHTLDALLFAYQKRDAPLGDYMKAALSSGIAFVSIVERASLASYLSGKTDIHPNVASETGAPLESADDINGINNQDGGTGRTSLQKGLSDAEIVKRIIAKERKIRTRNTILCGSKFVSFDYARQVAYDRYTKRSSSSTSRSNTSVGNGRNGIPIKKSKGRSPIIIISSAPSALITLSNVKRFLEDGVYESPRGRADSGLVTINRKKTGTDKIIQYHVIDSPGERLKPDDWDRVVCVFTNGQAWQFKWYKWTEPTELFHHVKGYLVQYSNEAPNSKTRDWNVTPLYIEPHKRHVDRSTVAEFWRSLEGWMAQRAPHLCPSN